MKNLFPLRAIFALAATLVAPAGIHAAIYTKADNTNSLDQTTSWVGGTAPGSSDIAIWSGNYSADPTTTNSLRAVLPASALAWQGIQIGALSGTALTINTIAAAATNITVATELTNIVTITTKANHAFTSGQAVTIAGVTPVAYNGTFIVLGVPSATSFTYSNSISGLTAGTTFGTVESAIYIGGLGAATAGSQLTIGTSGIDLSASTHSVNLNAAQFAFSGNQTWNTAAGTIIHFGASGTGAANAKAIASGSDGIINISGSGIVDLNEGGASGFSDAGGFTGFGGKWIVSSGATLRGLRNGATTFGSNTDPDAITLNGGTLAVGGISGDVGNWTWNTPITLAPGTTSVIDEQNVAGTGRSLKLNEVLTGTGNLIIKDTALGGASTFTSTDLGYILTGVNDFSGTLTIGGPIENGIAGRLTPVRIGGVNGGGVSTATGVGSDGTLGTGNIVNNGVLTFTLTSGLVVPGQISGTGTLRIGSLAASLVGAAYQAITLEGVNTYTGPTIINAGTLALGANGSIADSSSITISTNSVNGGAIINTFDVSALPSGFTAVSGQTLNINGGQINGNLNLAAGSTLNLVNGQINGNLADAAGGVLNLINSQISGNLNIAGGTNYIVPGGNNTVGTLTITGDFTLSGGSNTVVLDVNSAANDQLTVYGNLTASGVTTLQFVAPPTGLNAGTYTLLTAYGTLTATPANFSISGLASGARSQTFSIAVNGNNVQLVVVGSPGNLTWVGDGIANIWSTATTYSNWLNTITFAPDIFVSGDVVNFDDSGSATPPINLVGSLTPGSVTVNGSQNYTFGGSGQIAGATSLTVNDSGTLTINNSNNFTGPVAVNYGVVAITNEAALGEPTNYMAAALTLDNGGTLLITNTLTLGINTNRGIIIGANGGTLIVTNNATLTVSNVVGDLTGSSVLTKTGNGTLILDGNNNYGGGTIINGGVVVCGNSHALGLSGNWCPGFTLEQGIVDVNGQGNYSGAGVSSNFLFNSVFITFAGAPGATMELTDSAPGHAGFGVNGTAAINNVITYIGGNNPGKAIISAPWYAVGTGASVRTCVVEIDPSAATSVGLEFQGQMSSLDYEGKLAIIQKTGAGVMEISSTNYYPNMQVTEGTLLVNNTYALGADRSPNYNGVGTGSSHQLIVDGGTVDLNGFSPAIGALSDNGDVTTGEILNNGGSASTLTLGYSASNQVASASYAGTIADGASAVSINKIGTNTETLTGLDTYSGPTIVGGGALVINAPGQIGLGTAASTVTVTGGELGGSGMINAPILIQSGGTLAPGAGAVSTVTLTAATNLTLNGTTLMNVNKDIATSDLVNLSSGAISYGGTLAISTNLMLSTTLAIGDSFQLFSATNHTGNFSSISGSPGTGMAWSFNPATGTVSVIGYIAPPSITGISLSGTSLVITGMNGQVGEQYNVLTTTNLALPLSQWTVLSTNTFSSENFSITNAVDASAPQGFYLIRLPQN